MHLVVIGDIAWDIFIRPERDLVRGSDVFGTVDVMPGGAAANVAVWARRLGLDVTLRGKVGDDTLGQVMQAHLRREGLDAGLQIVPGGLTTRVGILLAADGEHSFVIDHTKVLRFGDGDAPAALADGADAVFFNGYDVFLARSAAFLDPVLAAARRRGTPVVFDPSSFALIGQYGAERLLANVGPLDVLIANEEDIQLALGIKTGGESGASTADAYYSLCRMTNTVFPNLRAIAVTLRENESADINKWSAILFNGNEQHHSTQYRIADVVDRVGVGDSFAAGLIYGMLNFSSNREILEFATAASCLKHSIPGDINLSTKEEIRSLAKGNSTGRISR